MITGHDIAMGLRAAYWLMHRQTNSCLARHGATAEQFVLLALLTEEEGITQQELCRRASSDPNTIRTILFLLEQRGLVKRGQHPTDGRARSVTLTCRGRRIFTTLSRELKPLQDHLIGLFQTTEAKSIKTFLERISKAMQPLNDY